MRPSPCTRTACSSIVSWVVRGAPAGEVHQSVRVTLAPLECRNGAMRSPPSRREFEMVRLEG